MYKNQQYYGCLDLQLCNHICFEKTSPVTVMTVMIVVMVMMVTMLMMVWMV